MFDQARSFETKITGPIIIDQEVLILDLAGKVFVHYDSSESNL